MSGSRFTALLTAISPQPLSRTLHRGVNLKSLLSKTPFEPLYVPGSANRYNPAGIRTLYFGEDFATAYAQTAPLRRSSSDPDASFR
jgi:hypothetical protein